MNLTLPLTPADEAELPAKARGRHDAGASRSPGDRADSGFYSRTRPAGQDREEISPGNVVAVWARALGEKSTKTVPNVFDLVRDDIA